MSPSLGYNDVNMSPSHSLDYNISYFPPFSSPGPDTFEVTFGPYVAQQPSTRKIAPLPSRGILGLAYTQREIPSPLIHNIQSGLPFNQRAITSLPSRFLHSELVNTHRDVVSVPSRPHQPLVVNLPRIIAPLTSRAIKSNTELPVPVAVALVAVDSVPVKHISSDNGRRKWTLIRSIGKGGCGEVFLAQEADPAHPEYVALKIVKDRKQYMSELETMKRLNSNKTGRGTIKLI